MRLDDLETFIRVASAGSLSAAARALGVPTSTVSRRIERLEGELGEALLVRAGRAVRLSDTGVAVFERCAQPLRDLDEVARAVRERDTEPQGELRVTAPMGFGNLPAFVEVILGFRAAWPRVRVRLELTERVVDLGTERFDVAVRAHLDPLPDRASLVTRRIAVVDGGVYASEAYLGAHGRPRTPEQLSAHAFVGHTRLVPRGQSLVLERGEERCEVAVAPGILVNDMSFVREAIVAGVGLGVLPTVLAGEGLVRVVPQWSAPSGSISLVWPESRALAPRVRAFVEHVAAAFPGATRRGGSRQAD